MCRVSKVVALKVKHSKFLKCSRVRFQSVSGRQSSLLRSTVVVSVFQYIFGDKFGSLFKVKAQVLSFICSFFEHID